MKMKIKLIILACKLHYFSDFQYGCILGQQQAHKGRNMGSSYCRFLYLYCDLHCEGYMIFSKVTLILILNFLQAIQDICVTALIVHGEKQVAKMKNED